jgi:hypothetical protein
MTLTPPAPPDGAVPDRPPERPPISAPPELHGRASLAEERRQPRLGLAGLLLVVPVTWLLAFGAGGAEPSLLVLGPLVTFGLPVIAMVAFWWDDWPGTRLQPSWSGWADTVLIAVAAIVLAGLGQSIAGELDARGIFDPTPGPGHAPTFPATLSLAGAAFVAMLQLTLVCEGWPLRRLPPLPAGIVALAVSWVVALLLYAVLADVHPPAGSGLAERHGPLPAGDLGALLVLVGAWQVWFYVAWRGWPFSGIAGRAARLLAANAVVVGGGVLTYVLAHDAAGVGSARITAAAGCFVAAGLLLGMLFEDWLRLRLAMLAGIVVLGAALGLLLQSYADGLDWTRASADEWVAHAGLNAIGGAVILHVAIGRRWPFAGRVTP